MFPKEIHMDKIKNIVLDDLGRIISFEINVDNPEALKFKTINEAYEEAKKMIKK